jgi:hypothetical protein
VSANSNRLARSSFLGARWGVIDPESVRQRNHKDIMKKPKRSSKQMTTLMIALVIAFGFSKEGKHERPNFRKESAKIQLPCFLPGTLAIRAEIE